MAENINIERFDDQKDEANALSGQAPFNLVVVRQIIEAATLLLEDQIQEDKTLLENIASCFKLCMIKKMTGHRGTM